MMHRASRYISTASLQFGLWIDVWGLPKRRVFFEMTSPCCVRPSMMSVVMYWVACRRLVVYDVWGWCEPADRSVLAYTGSTRPSQHPHTTIAWQVKYHGYIVWDNKFTILKMCRCDCNKTIGTLGHFYTWNCLNQNLFHLISSDWLIILKFWIFFIKPFRWLC